MDVFRFQIVVLVESLDLHVLGGLGIVIEQVDWTLLLSLFAKCVILAPVGTILAVVYGGSHGGNHHKGCAENLFEHETCVDERYRVLKFIILYS